MAAASASASASASAASSGKTWEEVEPELKELIFNRYAEWKRENMEYHREIHAVRAGYDEREADFRAGAIPRPPYPLFRDIGSEFVQTKYPRVYAHLASSGAFQAPSGFLGRLALNGNARNPLGGLAFPLGEPFKLRVSIDLYHSICRHKNDPDALSEDLVRQLNSADMGIFLAANDRSKFGEIQGGNDGEYLLDRVPDDMLIKLAQWLVTATTLHDVYERMHNPQKIVSVCRTFVNDYIRKRRAHLVDNVNYRHSNVQLALERLPAGSAIARNIIGPMVSNLITPTGEGRVQARRGRETTSSMLSELQNSLKWLSPSQVQTELARISQSVGQFTHEASAAASAASAQPIAKRARKD